MQHPFPGGFAGPRDWQAEQSPTDPAQHVDWEIHSGSIVSVWDVPSLCAPLLCPLSRDEKEGGSQMLCAFLQQLRVQLKPES